MALEKVSQEELDKAVDEHVKWLKSEGGARLDFRLKDLTGLDYKKFRTSNLSGADLSRADLSRAYLSGAYLSGADLSRAYLSRADLSRADLSGAYLSGAYLSGADLSRADLSRADLSGAYLSGAYLSRAENIKDISPRSLENFRRDIRLILFENQAEVQGLLKSIQEGKIDGSVYSGECACLMGTIANVKGCSVDMLVKDSNRPAEIWFLGIKPGDTPSTNQFSEMAQKWVGEWMAQYQPKPEVKLDGGPPATV